MEIGKTLSYITVAAGVIGIIVVGYFLTTSSIPATSSGFTEIYFENYARLPPAMEVGEKYTIPFVVVSKERAQTAYNYSAALGGRVFARGEFTLSPNEKKLVALELIPLASGWNLSSQRSKSLDSFPIAAPLIEQGRDGDVIVYHSAEPPWKDFLLPLEKGIYTASLGLVDGTRRNETASLVISEREIWMEYVLKEQNYTALHVRKWRNKIQLNEQKPSAVVWLAMPRANYTREQVAVEYKNTHLNFREGLPGELYLQPLPDIEANYSIAYELIDIKANEKKHVQKNATVMIGRNVSVERIIEEKTYTFEKAKLSVMVESRTGKSYEIHLWVYVDSIRLSPS